MNQSRPDKQFHYGWVIVAAGALTLFSCLGLARFAYGMLLPGMRVGLGLGFDQMGFVSTGNFLGYLVSVALTPRVIASTKAALRARPPVSSTWSTGSPSKAGRSAVMFLQIW